MNRRMMLCALPAALAACAGTNFSWDKARQLEVGMKPADVEAIMGPPNNVKSTPEGMIWVWVWVNLTSETRTLSVVFKNGVLAKVPEIPDSYR